MFSLTQPSNASADRVPFAVRYRGILLFSRAAGSTAGDNASKLFARFHRLIARTQRVANRFIYIVLFAVGRLVIGLFGSTLVSINQQAINFSAAHDTRALRVYV